MESSKPLRVLSIQSHVVHGNVGNKSATFPLQVLGFEVDAINSVQFSNHTGYEHIKGQVMDEKELSSLFEGLELNNLHSSYTHLLTGYIGNELFLRKIGDIVKKLRKVNPNLIYVCDPVMGDDGKMYVPKSLLPIYRDEIIPLADIATPNQFEVELLTETKIESEDDAWKSLNWFHERGVSTVALSSSDLGSSDILMAYLSHKKGDSKNQYKVSIPKLGGRIHFTGTGDLFAALFLAHSTLDKNIGKAMEKTISTLHTVIKNTLASMPEGKICFFFLFGNLVLINFFFCFFRDSKLHNKN